MLTATCYWTTEFLGVFRSEGQNIPFLTKSTIKHLIFEMFKTYVCVLYMYHIVTYI